MFPRQQWHSNNGTVFSVRSVLTCYKQDKLVSQSVDGLVGWLVGQSVRGLLGLSRCELFVLKAGSRGREPFRNPQEEERTPSEAVTKRQLGKTETTLCVL
jgi:hypothetical protein